MSRPFNAYLQATRLDRAGRLWATKPLNRRRIKRAARIRNLAIEAQMRAAKEALKEFGRGMARLSTEMGRAVSAFEACAAAMSKHPPCELFAKRETANGE